MVRTYTLPLRSDCFYSLPKSRERIRPVVAQLAPGKLEVSSEALQLLSLLSGRYLRTPQREILLAVLREHLTDTRYLGASYGPLAMTDVLGAVLGLAAFLVDGRSDWNLIRIPEGATPSADIFAQVPGGAPWNLELKATAPLSSEVEGDESLDTCKNVLGRRAEGLVQLSAANKRTKAPADAPSLTSLAMKPLTSGRGLLGGRALAIAILPDAALTARRDIAPNRSRGCPAGGLCAQHCFASHVPPYVTAAGVLRWEEADRKARTRSSADDAFERMLLAAQDVDSARWAGSDEGVDRAGEAFARELATSARELPDDVVEVAGRQVIGSLRDQLAEDTLLTMSQVLPPRLRQGVRDQRPRQPRSRPRIQRVDGTDGRGIAEIVDSQLGLGGTLMDDTVQLAPIVHPDVHRRRQEPKAVLIERTGSRLQALRRGRPTTVISVDVKLNDQATSVGLALVDVRTNRTIALSTYDGRVTLDIDA